MNKRDIAIIGMSAVFPGAPDLHSYWNNILQKVDATGPIPANRINERYFRPDSGAYDRFYCSKGGFIDDYACFDPVTFGILPLAVEGMEPDQLLTLQLVHQALEDAGVWKKKFKLDKTSIIIGKGNYVGPGATRAVEVVHVAEQLVNVLQELMPNLKDDELERIKKEFQKKKGRFTPDTAMGLIPNLVASLIANRFDLGGAAYTVDAACASSLLAIDHAVNELVSNRSDMVIAGGVHVGQNATFWSIFHQLGALSKRQQSRPFDKNADGLIIGEGCGFVVLKTLEKALLDGDRIYCVIKGVGISSDGSGTSVMSPSTKGQVKAIEQAWQQAGVPLNDIGYIEAHGTATSIGDRTELETLKLVFGSANKGHKAKIGSVKSMIGHAMPAAGIAGIIKTALALYKDVIPPTLHCDSPIDTMAETRFEPVREPISWSASGLPLRAGVNAFGFGGINAHVVLEAFTSGIAQKVEVVTEDQVRLLARDSRDELILALESGSNEIGNGDFRIALFNPTEDRIKKAINIVTKDKPWRNRQDIWYTNSPLLHGQKKIAFLFPGLDGLSSGETETISHYFKIEQEFRLEDSMPKTNVFLSALKQLQNSRTIDLAMKKLGIEPDVNAGHSMGEWLAAMSAGLVTSESVKHLITKLDPHLFEVNYARFIAIGCSYERIKDLLARIPSLYLANDNCPQQVILCGTYAAIDQLVNELKVKQIFHQVLPFQSGFHSPFIKDRVPQILEGIEQIDFLKVKIPIWSATNLAPYPDTVEEIKQLNVEHLIQPVRFRELIEKLYHEENVRVFIQVGAGGITGFVDDTLKGNPYNALSASSSHRNGLSQLRRILAALYVDGKEIDFNFLGLQIKSPNKNAIKLNLGIPLINKWNFPVSVTAKANTDLRYRSVKRSVKHPLAMAVMDNMEEAVNMYSDLIDLIETKGLPNSTQQHFLTGRNVSPVADHFETPLNISLDQHSYLIDHALVKQKPGWHCPEDMDPVIPMTMILELLGEAAFNHQGQHNLSRIQQIRVFQWMNVSKPFQEKIIGRKKSDHTWLVHIDKYAEAEVVLAQNLDRPSVQTLPIGNLLDIQTNPTNIYDRHMFHGPSYQGIKSVDSIGDQGIKGIIVGSGGKGSLLDNAGQLFGLWLQLTLKVNKVAFPIKIGEIIFHEDFKDQHGEFECTCSLTEINEETATADFLLKRDGKVWASINGWQNIRLEFDERLWQVSMSPEFNILSDEIYPGIFKFHKAYQKVISWDFIAKRYLPFEDRNYLNTLAINKRKKWLISRVAVRDAIRSLLLREKKEAYYPIEFTIAKLASGQPVIQGSIARDIQISIAHKNDEAVAIARFGDPVGIDMEEIKPRGAGFEEIALTTDERLLLKGKEDRDEWVTRFWVAKEAYGKSIGKGLAGNPKTYQVSALIEGGELIIENIKVKTIKYKNYIIGWTS
ncbi:beta-ketoacyl synthase N-terminal-like domain-containing protein [Olivibacter sp. CPCC 100613]|uniref:type I polyketide synthase n=1 Tax=Olivibacter sp. CPCC 100613 TaxID=3079931 RepID=UPI002FF60E2B